ncbi:hypothetical protein EAJ13_11940 [Bacteroides xylanisolvens]|nr:hypothetical protein EAJ13_11940 [Bacteroides xylanisolvens]
MSNIICFLVLHKNTVSFSKYKLTSRIISAPSLLFQKSFAKAAILSVNEFFQYFFEDASYPTRTFTIFVSLTLKKQVVK